MEAWQEHFPLCPFKRGQWGRRCPFIIGAGAGKFLGYEAFFSEFPQTCPKSFLCNFANKFSPTKIMKVFFWCDLQKKVFMCFSTNFGCDFLKSNNAGRHLYPDFQGFCSDFQQINTFGGALAPPAPPPPTPLLFITVS